MRADALERVARGIAQRHQPVAVEYLGIDAVACRAEARPRERVRGRRRRAVGRLRLAARERVDERRQRRRVLERRLRVHLAHLDRPEQRMRPHVPPEVGVVVDAAGPDDRVD